MTKKDVVVGETYRMKHTSGRIHVRILYTKTRQGYGHAYGNGRKSTHWVGLNLKTNREIEIKSAVKLSPV